MSKGQTKKTREAAGNRRKLTRAEKKQIAEAIRKAKGDGKARTAQQTIPYLAMYPDGICKVTEKRYSKCVVFEDINYQLAQADDKTAIFENWCDFLNYFDASVSVQLSFINQGTQREQAEKAISILIAGGSNFPTRKKEKQNAARDSNYREWQDIQGLLDKIRSTGMGGISADDPQAVQKLEKKLESLEKSQETMKAVNAYYRKHNTLDGCPHLPPEELEKLKADMASSWHLEDKPFATWALSNNSAEIRRVKDRIKSLSQQKEIGFVGWEFDGGKVEANTEANRLQIFFEDKPDEATREALKSNGFRWSPKAGAWQRQLTSNAYYAADYVKAIAPLTGEKPTEIQRAHIRQQKVAAQEQPAQEQPEQEAPQDKDTFSIFQIKGGDETRDLRFEPYDRLTATGHRVDPKNYALVYSAELTPGTSLEDIYTRFNIDHPKDFKGHSLSVSDVVVLHQNGQDTAHYVDNFGYKEVPEFLQPENYLKAAEQTTEQNYNMIDGQINNTPTAAELEEKAKAGEQISLAEYAEALKTDKERGKSAKQEKPSIRAQLKAAKEQTTKKQARQKTQDLERS